MKLLISKSYGKQKVFENFSLDIEEGKILCILGESGGGKTTLLKALANMLSFEGTMENVPEKVGYIFQEPRLLPSLTVEENLQYVGGMVESIEDILRKTELFAMRKKRPEELSGGEKQRVSIARAFLSDAPLLLLDEPFSSLDTALKIRLSRVFAELWMEKRPTVVFVTHDVEEACMLGHRIVVLKDGVSVCDIDAEKECTGKTLPRLYGSELLLKEKLLKALM